MFSFSDNKKRYTAIAAPCYNNSIRLTKFDRYRQTHFTEKAALRYEWYAVSAVPALSGIFRRTPAKAKIKAFSRWQDFISTFGKAAVQKERTDHRYEQHFYGNQPGRRTGAVSLRNVHARLRFRKALRRTHGTDIGKADKEHADERSSGAVGHCRYPKLICNDRYRGWSGQRRNP